MDKWYIAIYGNPYGGDHVLDLVSEQIFSSHEVAQLLVEHLEALDRYGDYDFVVKERRTWPPDDVVR
jgi:hypothetical protein